MAASRAVAEPAEAHGTLAGALCATGAYGFDDWLAEILPEGVAPGAAAVPPLRELYDATRAALHGTQMQFELLMPDDDAPIEQRTVLVLEAVHGGDQFFEAFFQALELELRAAAFVVVGHVKTIVPRHKRGQSNCGRLML